LPHVGGSFLGTAGSSVDARNVQAECGAAVAAWEHNFAATLSTLIEKKGQQEKVYAL